MLWLCTLCWLGTKGALVAIEVVMVIMTFQQNLRVLLPVAAVPDFFELVG